MYVYRSGCEKTQISFLRLEMESMGPELSKTVPGMSLRPLDRFLGFFKFHLRWVKIGQNRDFLVKIAKIPKSTRIQFCDKMPQNDDRNGFGWLKVHTFTKSILHQQILIFSCFLGPKTV